MNPTRVQRRNLHLKPSGLGGEDVNKPYINAASFASFLDLDDGRLLFVSNIRVIGDGVFCHGFYRSPGADTVTTGRQAVNAIYAAIISLAVAPGTEIPPGLIDLSYIEKTANDRLAVGIGYTAGDYAASHKRKIYIRPFLFLFDVHLF